MAEKRRVDIRAILADPDLRRELMVPTIQATQAREGIETTRDQAERAYYVVTETERTAFFDLERFRGGRKEPDRRNEMFVQTLAGEDMNNRLDVARRDFGMIQESPLAYRRVGIVAHIFREAPPLDPALASVTSGLMTVQSERIIRWHWEIPADKRSFLDGWSPLAKGGDFARFYRDIELLVDLGPRTIPLLEREGCLRNRSLYGREGLTWVPRTQRGFNVQHLPSGTVFGKKGPIILPTDPADQWWLLGLLNSELTEYLLQGLMSFGSYEVGVVQRLPVFEPNQAKCQQLEVFAKSIHDAKAVWDEGNETSTRFRVPWLLREDVGEVEFSIPVRLVRLIEFEAAETARIQKLYIETNNESFRVYSIPESTRAIIEQTLGERPPELVWPQMEGKTVDQKRMEHVFRLLSYVVKLVVEADEDGIVSFTSVAREISLLDRVHQELQSLFPSHDIGQIESEIANELKKTVKGYRRTSGIGEWLESAFFEYHCNLYKNRPIIWHIASAQGTARFAFGVLVHYHRFDRNRMAKLRSQYLRDAIERFRREAARADKAGNTEQRIEWQDRLDSAQELDRRLQLIQEGHHEGPEGGEVDFRILTPWKSPEQRPKGWEPDIDDGVKVNIDPIQKAGVLRVAKVI